MIKVRGSCVSQKRAVYPGNVKLVRIVELKIYQVASHMFIEENWENSLLNNE